MTVNTFLNSDMENCSWDLGSPAPVANFSADYEESTMWLPVTCNHTNDVSMNDAIEGEYSDMYSEFQNDNSPFRTYLPSSARRSSRHNTSTDSIYADRSVTSETSEDSDHRPCNIAGIRVKSTHKRVRVGHPMPLY